MIKKNANANAMLRMFAASAARVTNIDDSDTHRCMTFEKGEYVASFYLAKNGSFSSVSFGSYDGYDDFGWLHTTRGEYDAKELLANATHELLDIVLSETWGGKRDAAEFILDWLLGK